MFSALSFRGRQHSSRIVRPKSLCEAVFRYLPWAFVVSAPAFPLILSAALLAARPCPAVRLGAAFSPAFW